MRPQQLVITLLIPSTVFAAALWVASGDVGARPQSPGWTADGQPATQEGGGQPHQRRPEGGGRGQSQGEPQRAVPRTRPEPPRPDTAAKPRPHQEPPHRGDVPSRYFAVPRPYYFPPIDVRLGFYYHPFFGFYYGPYYGPYYPYPGPFITPTRYSVSAIRLRVKPVETDVFLNGYYAGIVDDFDGVFQRLYVPSGQHQLELRLDGYQSFRQGVFVAPGDTLEVTHRMEPLPPGERAALPPEPGPLPDDWGTPEPGGPTERPASPYGILAIRTEPADVQIVIDGEAWEPAAGQHEFVIHLPPGWHQLEVRKAEYHPFATRVQLTESQTTRLSVRLDK